MFLVAFCCLHLLLSILDVFALFQGEINDFVLMSMFLINISTCRYWLFSVSVNIIILVVGTIQCCSKVCLPLLKTFWVIFLSIYYRGLYGGAFLAFHHIYSFSIVPTILFLFTKQQVCSMKIYISERLRIFNEIYKKSEKRGTISADIAYLNSIELDMRC